MALCHRSDPSRTLEQESSDTILEAIRLTATSSGLQPYEVLVVTNKEIREKLNLMPGIGADYRLFAPAIVCRWTITPPNALTACST